MKYIVFDLEATCYDKNSNLETKPKGFVNEIIEIGAYKLNEQGEIIDSFNKFLKPKRFPFISKFCNQLTSITQDDIDYADYAHDVLHDFLAWVPFDAKFVSWGHYDKRQLRDDLRINGFHPQVIEDSINDKNHVSLKHLHGEINKCKPMGLGRAIEREGFVFEGVAHRGIDDAKNIVKIFNRYIQYI